VTLIVWSLSFFFDSMKSDLPWLIDGAPEGEVASELYNESYFTNEVLKISEGPSVQGGIVGPLCGWLALAYFIVYLVTFKGVKSIGKAVYLTTTLPYLILLILFCKGLTLQGCEFGIGGLF